MSTMHTYKFEYLVYDHGTKTGEVEVHTERAFTAADARVQASVNFEGNSFYSLNNYTVTLRRMWTEEEEVAT